MPIHTSEFPDGVTYTLIKQQLLGLTTTIITKTTATTTRYLHY